MAEKSRYNYRVEPQDVDFTLRATIPSLGGSILNTAGIDAHGKGFGVDALNADNHSWVLSRMAVEFDCQPTQYTDYTVATWISDYGRVLSTRNFTLTDAAGREFGRAVTQWAMIDLQSRSAMDLSWVGDAHADAVVDAAVRLRASGVQFLRATGAATPAYTGALAATTAGLDVAACRTAGVPVADASVAAELPSSGDGRSEGEHQVASATDEQMSALADALREKVAAAFNESGEA